VLCTIEIESPKLNENVKIACTAVFTQKAGFQRQNSALPAKPAAANHSFQRRYTPPNFASIPLIFET